MTTGMVHEQNLENQIEKQMGCMAGFLQLFDRHQILSGKKLYTAKRITSATRNESLPEPEKTVVTKPNVATPSPERRKPSLSAEVKSPAVPETPPSKSPKVLPIFELKESSKSSPWKLKETGRLSLDSRATYDAAKGSLHRKEIRKDRVILSESQGDDVDDDKQRARSSTSVIARLMGLEPLSQPDSEPVKPPELRRSASESRVSRDFFHYRFVDSNNVNMNLPNQSHYSNESNNPLGMRAFMNDKSGVRRQQQSKATSKSTWRSVFEAAEVFPEPPKKAVPEAMAIEKRLKMRGIDDASRDLETLKQILEAWQLKGLLHSKSHRNVVYDHRSFTSDESPIIVMRPSRSPVRRRTDTDSSQLTRGGTRRNPNYTGESLPSVSPRRDRNVQSPTRPRSPSNGNGKRSKSIVKPKPLTVETKKKVNESTENRRLTAPIHSPKVSPRRIGSDQAASRSPRNHRKPTAEINPEGKLKISAVITEDESSSISESTVSISSQTDIERYKMEEYKEGKSLLERCDKLLHSIAEMNATDQQQQQHQQSSPVSVLDSSFYESPSPIMKRTIDFKDHAGEAKEHTWSQLILEMKTDDTSSDDCDLVYISEILKASHYLPGSDIFSLLEKQQYIKGKDTSKVSRLQRKLIFDTIAEILKRNKNLPPWKESNPAKPTLQKIWLEFRKIREHDYTSTDNNLVEIICGVLKKDLAGDTVTGWGECPVEHSAVVLEIERMIFRDLVGETIRDLADLVGPRRKLVF